MDMKEHRDILIKEAELMTNKLKASTRKEALDKDARNVHLRTYCAILRTILKIDTLRPDKTIIG